MRGIGKRFVYVLRSDADHEHHYVGITSDVAARLEWHNHGPCGHTTRHRPWSLVVVLEFPAERQALRFERYLKTASGRAFASRHFGDLGPTPASRGGLPPPTSSLNTSASVTFSLPSASSRSLCGPAHRLAEETVVDRDADHVAVDNGAAIHVQERDVLVALDAHPDLLVHLQRSAMELVEAGPQ